MVMIIKTLTFMVFQRLYNLFSIIPVELKYKGIILFWDIHIINNLLIIPMYFISLYTLLLHRY